MPLETHYFNWESVYDDSQTDYLYSRVSFANRSIVNGISSVVQVNNGPPMNYGLGQPTDQPLSTSDTLRAGPTFGDPTGSTFDDTVLTVPAGFGMDARNRSPLRKIVRDPKPGGGINTTELTHQAVRYRLSMPRGKLYIFWGTGMESGSPAAGSFDAPGEGPNAQFARLFLESPAGQDKCDAKNGPFPRLFGVTQAAGDATTLIVDWGIETFVIESDLNEVMNTGALLSNRFSQSHEVREDGFTVITTQGVAIFRTDRLYANPASGDINESPDESRPFLFMPIPFGFTRKVLYVRGREDGTGIEYAFQDTQQSVNFVAGPFVKAASIAAIHRQAVSTHVDFAGSALNTYERILGIQANKHIARGDTKNVPARQPIHEIPYVPGMTTPSPIPKS